MQGQHRSRSGGAKFFEVSMSQPCQRNDTEPTENQPPKRDSYRRDAIDFLYEYPNRAPHYCGKDTKNYTAPNFTQTFPHRRIYVIAA